MTKVLVIEDDDQMRRAMVCILARAKYLVVEASDGQQGIDQFQAHRPTVVVTDIFMPNKDGFEVINELQRIAPSVPVITVSGGGVGGNMEFLNYAKHIGANRSLAKPFGAADLISSVEGVIADFCTRALLNLIGE